MRAILVISAAVVAALSLGGCAPLGEVLTRDREPTASDIALAILEQALHPVAYDHNTDIYFVARSVATAIETSSVQLIAINEIEAKELIDSFGSLDFLLPQAQGEGESQPSGPFCFRVGFGYYGAEQSGDRVAAEKFDCPEDAVAIAPPPDTTVYPVIAENAREAVHEVLNQLAAGDETPSVEQIADRIRDLLTPPTSELQSLADPQVVEINERIGVAMQDANDCLLVRLVDDTVDDVYPPAVLLQPGELGCSASTAIADGDQLRSPH